MNVHYWDSPGRSKCSKEEESKKKEIYEVIAHIAHNLFLTVVIGCVEGLSKEFLIPWFI